MTTNQDRAAQLLYNEGCGSGDTAHYIARRLADAGLLTPDPKPRTLADMTREERETCRWMQADFDHSFADPPIRVVIGKCHGGTIDIILPGGSVSCVYPETLTPLPDLPRMAWPEEQATNHYTNQEKK